MTIDKPPSVSEDEPADECEKSVAPPAELIEGLDYYIENGLFVFTQYYLQKRGYCCEHDCRHCPYREANFRRA
jgi:hypothetical protein